jgi:hypothetical protein
MREGTRKCRPAAVLAELRLAHATGVIHLVLLGLQE